MFSLFQEIIWHEKGRKKLLLSFWQAASTITQYLVVLNHLSDRFFISLFNFAYIYSTFFLIIKAIQKLNCTQPVRVSALSRPCLQTSACQTFWLMLSYSQHALQPTTLTQNPSFFVWRYFLFYLPCLFPGTRIKQLHDRILETCRDVYTYFSQKWDG